MTEDRSPTLELHAAAQDNPDAATPLTANTHTDTPQPARRHAARPKKPGFFARRAIAANKRAAEQAARKAELAAELEARNAGRQRTVRQVPQHTTRSADEIAPVPERLQKLGVWADRTFGALPLIAPLVVSGWFTAHVFMDQPINLPYPVAVLVTLALEGGAWKLQRLYEKTLLEGDSTIMLRAGIFLYLSLISGGIYWHAWYIAEVAGKPLGMSWVPAAITAAMSALGVFISGRDARYKHRFKLRAAGKIDRQAPKFAILSFVLMPWTTCGALRHAVKYRIEMPAEAFEDYLAWKGMGKPSRWSYTPPSLNNDPEPAPPPQTPAEPLVARPKRPVREQRPVASQAPAPAQGAPTPSPRPSAESTDDLPAEQDVPADAGSEPKTTTTLTTDEILGVASLILAIAEIYPNWMTDEKLPSERAAIAAINEVKQRVGESFNSKKRAALARRAMSQIKAQSPRERQQVMDQLRPLASIPS